MKIAVATNDNLTVAGHVGRCNAFLVFETKESKILGKGIRKNSFTHHRHHLHNHHEHGEGHENGHSGLIDGLKDCNVLIFNHGGWRLIEDLKAHSIRPILTDEKLAENAVIKYLTGELIVSEDNVCNDHN
jgi:predicted Fe-Mo cluster-binding NifX family protein